MHELSTPLACGNASRLFLLEACQQFIDIELLTRKQLRCGLADRNEPILQGIAKMQIASNQHVQRRAESGDARLQSFEE